MTPNGYSHPDPETVTVSDQVEVVPAEEVAPDVSTAPPTTPAPPSGVLPVVNAVSDESEVPGPRMDPSRIGEALRPPEAESPPVED